MTRALSLTNLESVVAAVLTVSIGWFADRTRARGWCNIGISILGIVGFAMLLGAPDDAPGIKYAGTFLGAAGIYPTIANTISWCANNTEGVYKRGVTLGFVIGWGNLNGVVASNIYRAQDKPGYKLGHGVVLAYLTLFLFGGSVVTHFVLQDENRKRRAGKRDAWMEGKSDEDIKLMGDKRYVLYPGPPCWVANIAQARLYIHAMRWLR